MWSECTYLRFNAKSMMRLAVQEALWMVSVWKLDLMRMSFEWEGATHNLWQSLTV